MWKPCPPAVVLFLVGILCLSGCSLSVPVPKQKLIAAPKPYIVVKNAQSIYTGVDEADPVESFCWGTHDGKIRKVGSLSEVTAACPNHDVMNAAGAHIIPGLTDSHAHLMMEGMKMIQPQFDTASSVDEVVAIVEDFVRVNKVQPGTWIRGFGWDQNRFCASSDCPFPTKDVLDSAFPDNPLFLVRIDGHCGWANDAAIKSIPPLPAHDPTGGRIIRNNVTGEPTGIFTDKAMMLVTDHIPWPSLSMQQRALRTVLDDCAANGLTGLHDPGVDPRYIKLFQDTIDSGNFTLRTYVMRLGVDGAFGGASKPTDPKIENYGNLMSVKAVKFFMDGALGSWGAAMLENYTDRPDEHGYFRITPESYISNVSVWTRAGYQVATHAIGDAANRLVIDTYENVTRIMAETQGIPTGGLRLRVEHAQITALSDIPRFAQNKLIPSMQPTHATSDMLFAKDRLGPERLKGAYAWESFVKSNVSALPFGSDFPTVGVVPPLLGLHSAVTRQNTSNLPAGGWTPGQKVSRVQALKGYTTAAAYASFQENSVGTLEAGKFADFVMLGQDYFTVPGADIWKIPIWRTVVGGKSTYVNPNVTATTHISADFVLDIF